MELKIKEYQSPSEILFNYEEIKAEIEEKAETYKSTVYSPDQMKTAKADRASLNKFKKALNDARIAKEKEYMKPFDDFKTKINNLIAIIDEPIKAIDVQIKQVQNKEKAEKLDKIQMLWDNSNTYDWLEVGRVLNPKWLNASTSISSIQEDIEAILVRVGHDLELLQSLSQFSHEAIQEYKRTLDIAAVNSYLKKLSEDTEPEPKEEPKEEPKRPAKEEARQWVSFSAHLSIAEALALKDFFNSKNIEFKPIKEA